MALFLDRRDCISMEVDKSAEGRINYSISVNGTEVMKTSTKDPHCERWCPSKSDDAASIAWTFAIDSPKGEYELVIRQVRPEEQECNKGKVLHRVSGKSSSNATHQSIGNLVVFFPPAQAG